MRANVKFKTACCCDPLPRCIFKWYLQLACETLCALRCGKNKQTGRTGKISYEMETALWLNRVTVC